MKKNLISIIIAFVLCFSVNAISQTCQWAERIGGTGNDHAYSITNDANGNM
jgi:TM2 domain-containing membrane protein YozV